MNWDALGAIGEIIGAIAVLATLYYLAAQIKMQNRELEKSNKNVTAQLSFDINNMLINNNDALMRDKEFVQIYQKGISNQLLDEIEAIQF
jgi:predicted small secreted protein